MNDLTEFQYKLSLIHLDLYHLALDIDTTDEEAEVVDKILEVFHGAWEAVPIPEGFITEAKEIMDLAQLNRNREID